MGLIIMKPIVSHLVNQMTASTTLENFQKFYLLLVNSYLENETPKKVDINSVLIINYWKQSRLESLGEEEKKTTLYIYPRNEFITTFCKQILVPALKTKRNILSATIQNIKGTASSHAMWENFTATKETIEGILKYYEYTFDPLLKIKKFVAEQRRIKLEIEQVRDLLNLCSSFISEQFPKSSEKKTSQLISRINQVHFNTLDLLSFKTKPISPSNQVELSIAHNENQADDEVLVALVKGYEVLNSQIIKTHTQEFREATIAKIEQLTSEADNVLRLIGVAEGSYTFKYQSENILDLSGRYARKRRKSTTGEEKDLLPREDWDTSNYEPMVTERPLINSKSMDFSTLNNSDQNKDERTEAYDNIDASQTIIEQDEGKNETLEKKVVENELPPPPPEEKIEQKKKLTPPEKVIEKVVVEEKKKKTSTPPNELPPPPPEEKIEQKKKLTPPKTEVIEKDVVEEKKKKTSTPPNEPPPQPPGQEIKQKKKPNLPPPKIPKRIELDSTFNDREDEQLTRKKSIENPFFIGLPMKKDKKLEVVPHLDRRGSRPLIKISSHENFESLKRNQKGLQRKQSVTFDDQLLGPDYKPTRHTYVSRFSSTLGTKKIPKKVKRKDILIAVLYGIIFLAGIGLIASGILSLVLATSPFTLAFLKATFALMKASAFIGWSALAVGTFVLFGDGFAAIRLAPKLWPNKKPLVMKLKGNAKLFQITHNPFSFIQIPHFDKNLVFWKKKGRTNNDDQAKQSLLGPKSTKKA